MSNQEVKWEYKDFQIIGMIGKGEFGVVYKAVDCYSKIVVALKIMSKKHFHNERLQLQLKRQIQIHSRLKYKYIAQMYGWFQDQNNVYVVLQYCKGSSIFNEIRVKKSILNEKQIKKYMKQLALAVTYLHQRNVIHRDIKLQNAIITAEGIKLIDFGWSVHSITSYRKTICGTPEYLPPQIVKGNKYNQAVDVYSLGVLFYELFHGKSPYEDQTDQKIYENIKKAQLKFEQKQKPIDKEARQLISKMMNPNGKQRIGIKDVLFSPYLSKVQPQQLIY